VFFLQPKSVSFLGWLTEMESIVKVACMSEIIMGATGINPQQVINAELTSGKK